MGEAAPQSPLAAHLNVPDYRGCLGKYRTTPEQQGGLLYLGVSGHGADGDGLALLADKAEIGDPAQIDQVRGFGEPQFHERDQALAAGKDFCVLARLQQIDRLFQRGRRMVFKWGRDHKRTFASLHRRRLASRAESNSVAREAASPAQSKGFAWDLTRFPKAIM